MKKYLFIVSLLLLLSCDPVYNTFYFVENNSNSDLTIYLYNPFIETINDTINTYSGNIDTIYRYKDVVLISNLYIYCDSVIFTFSNNKILKYYPSDTLKNEKSFFREEDWSIEQLENRVYNYRFTITEEDLE